METTQGVAMPEDPKTEAALDLVSYLQGNDPVALLGAPDEDLPDEWPSPFQRFVSAWTPKVRVGTLSSVERGALVDRGVTSVLEAIDADIVSGLTDPEAWKAHRHGAPRWFIDDFSLLHNHVDANEYLIKWANENRVHFDADDEASTGLFNEITDEISERLNSRVVKCREFARYLTDDGFVRVVEVPWLPVSHRFVVHYEWSDDDYFPFLSWALIRYGLLVACCEVSGEIGAFFTHSNEEAARSIAAFISNEVAYSEPVDR